MLLTCVAMTLPMAMATAIWKVLYFDGDQVVDGLVLTDDGWVSVAEGSEPDPMMVSVAAGQTVDLPSKGL